MTNKEEKEQQVLSRLVRWAEKQEAIRAMLLTSSRTNPHAELDSFSDYDVILVVKDIQPFLKDESWLEDFGKVLVMYRDPVKSEYGFEKFGRVTHYQNYTKIDYAVWPVGLMKKVIKMPELPDYLDDGYKVLVDKDNLTKGMKPPTYTAFIPKPPTGKEYREIIDNFFNETAYVAKTLRRDNIFAVKLNLDNGMKIEYLRTMLEWLMEIENGWTLKTGAYGKGLKKRIRPQLWAELESTYVGAGKEENWEALFKTIELFRKVATEVGNHLGYTYPIDMDRRVVKYLQNVRNNNTI
jgi:aminoglycoside 6-adenylyltransferase